MGILLKERLSFRKYLPPFPAGVRTSQGRFKALFEPEQSLRGRGQEFRYPLSRGGVTPFRSPDPATNHKSLLLVALNTVLDGLNPATGAPSDNLTAGLFASE